MRTRVVFGCAGTELTAEERALFQTAQPWGFILFARNVSHREQVKRLVTELRETVDDACAPILIDQEGGRVARLKPPEWAARPAARRFGELYERTPQWAREAGYLNARLIAHDLAELGITVNCIPVLDVPVEGANEAIGDRAFSRDPSVVIQLGRAVMEGLMDGGVLPVMKHAPGHGRANVDSHEALPHVSAAATELSATDFVTFRSLNDCPLAMSAHVVFDSIDAQRPATTSSRIVHQVIRNEIGFDGLLLSDDLSMKALEGSLSARTKSALHAGCDIAVHCNGDMDEMRDVAREAEPLEGESAERARRAQARLKPPQPLDIREAEIRLGQLLESLA